MFYLVLLIALLTGCSSNEKMTINNSYLSLSGESESWKVKSYDIEMTPNMSRAGNGKVIMKDKTNYNTDLFSIRVHAVIDNNDKIIQGKSVTSSGGKIDIAQETTGTTEITEPIPVDNINNIYMVIKWQDTNKNKTSEERINLFSKKTFFN
ncbi:hypothetical protein [Halobacillus naozhouensis]|uniref:Uncharacterized protein n=2 Tax=Halobacillus naozhouensis TaxID=554880 RepID=A0ABY8IXT3_9BACI|nr:hypothetical protein [Halobacillus naozhouensis]WFT74157.1 hypothetical protein P9989_17595 [Halobacillus naozhouensis]